MGFVDGLPNATNSRNISSTDTVTTQPTDGNFFINEPNGSIVNIVFPTAIDNKNRIISVCMVNYTSNAQVVISTFQITGGYTTLNFTVKISV